jgi:hypothetical protein
MTEHEPSTITPRERFIVLGLVASLAEYCASPPELVIRSLTGVLWNNAEGKILLKDAAIFHPLADEVHEQKMEESRIRVSKYL